MDDIIVYSRTFEQPLEDIRAVLERLRDAGLRLKPSKCQFLQKEVTYLDMLSQQKS